MPEYFKKSEKVLLKADKDRIKRFKQVLGFKPGKPELYQLALVHRSAANKVFQKPYLNNERLEFLGDAVLDSIIAEHLFLKFPDEDEGFLTQLRSKIVNRETLKRISIKLGIGNMVISKVTNDNHKAVYGDALEAIIGAMYLDKGYTKTKKFILTRIVDHHINLKLLSKTEHDFKSRIIEWSQKHKKEIVFNCDEGVSENNLPVFTSHVLIQNEVFGIGTGGSKKEAEQYGAKQALKKIQKTN